MEKCLGDFSVLQNLDAIFRLPDDGARIAADERVASQMFAALDRLEQKRFARAADFAIGRERRFNVGEQASRDGNHVALRGQLQKFIRRLRIHEIIFSRSAEKTKAGSRGKIVASEIVL